MLFTVRGLLVKHTHAFASVDRSHSLWINYKCAGCEARGAGAAPGQSPLLPVSRQTDGADHVRRALWGGAEHGFWLRALPGHAAEGWTEFDARLLWRLCRTAGSFQHCAQ